jgi:hypothetical protein
MKRPYPSLSSKGWIEDAPGVLDSVTANFFLTHPSLATEFSAEIEALPVLIQQYGDSEVDIQREMRTSLTTLFSRYFDDPTVEVTVNYPFADDYTRMNVAVMATVKKDGESFNVARELQLINSKVVNVMDINNG